MTNIFYSDKSNTLFSQMGIVSKSTSYLKELQRRIPVVGDKALIDLVNGIEVGRDMIRYRKRQGFFGQLIDTLDGSDRQRQILLGGNLLDGQEVLHHWILELSDSLAISQVALEATQQSLLEARDVIRAQKQGYQIQEADILVLSQQLNDLAEKIGTKLSELEARVRQLELRVAAYEDLDRIVTAWAAKQTYTKLPWAMQVALLAREVFSSSVAIFELETGDRTQFRQLLINKIIATSKQLPKSFFGLADLLDQSWAEMPASASQLSRNSYATRQLAAFLLEIRSVPRQRLLKTPLLFVIGTTLELATLPDEAMPTKPAQSAIALCRAQIDSVSHTTDAREFVTAVVEETANDCLAMMR